jgi:16S rRNA (cytosine1402-N4)-methyltransferase
VGNTPALQAADHIPVLYSQVMEGLQVRTDGRYFDGTFGRGGHARGVLDQLGPGGRLLVMDKDPEAMSEAERLQAEDPRVHARQGSFASMGLWDEVIQGLDGILLDLGVSSPQIDVAERGFSFQADGPLDMRMDPDSGESVAQWLARAEESDIANVLWRYGEEKLSRRIARAIVTARAESPLLRTSELAELIEKTIGRREPGKHPATRSFQALRIFINGELDDLDAGLEAAHAALLPGGRLAVISFHSLEDRAVKRFITSRSRPAPGNRRLPELPTQAPTLREVSGAIKADSSELALNPRARSAVLRVAEKLG